jgi:hypothetical protein
MPPIVRGFAKASSWPGSQPADGNQIATPDSNRLREYFDSHHEGPGIWKWRHYFDIYAHHFERFVGRDVHVAEVGVYSGGSLAMWHHYFGSKAQIYGIDINESCMTYADETTRIFIGDQADRSFWARFREAVPVLDILIDDGGHLPHQQIATLEEMLGHLQPGGIYLCEDVHGLHNEFAAYVCGMTMGLNGFDMSAGEHMEYPAEGIQRTIGGIHMYPYMVVIEKVGQPVERFTAPKRGSHWQPF